MFPETKVGTDEYVNLDTVRTGVFIGLACWTVFSKQSQCGHTRSAANI